MELVVVRINWQQDFAFAPIISDGNIFGTKNVYFCNTFLQFYAKILYTKKGHDPFGPVVTQYYELRGETICIEQPAIPALQCIKNQLPTRSGSICTGRSLYEMLKQFPGPRKVLET